MKDFRTSSPDLAQVIHLVADIAYAGMRCDMNPTMQMDFEHGVPFLLNYFSSNLDRLQERCLEVLGLTDTKESRRYLYGLIAAVSEGNAHFQFGVPFPPHAFKTEEESRGYTDGAHLSAIINGKKQSADWYGRCELFSTDCTSHKTCSEHGGQIDDCPYFPQTSSDQILDSIGDIEEEMRASVRDGLDNKDGYNSVMNQLHDLRSMIKGS